jgi:small subunit ribosomal protein S16
LSQRNRRLKTEDRDGSEAAASELTSSEGTNMLSIRMRRTGSKKRPYYRVVVAEGREPREGSFLEVLGTYNPRTKPAVVELDKERINHWMKNGARPSDSVRTLLARHLTKDRGVVATPVTAEAAAPRE